MTTDTAWLLGSISKVLTTTLLLKYVEAGRIDLDAPITRYLPGFRLAEEGAAERIRVRQLVNHTNGIDADTLMPAREFGPNAVQSYVDALSGIGTLFAPAGLPRDFFSGVWGRMGLLSFHEVGRRRYAHSRFRAYLKA